ncbi:MAG: hypothetical protein IT444_06800 [Phycisphaeraceae bacterium]|nr:hypothetical protein [Phycisphaeraceae bacterium]
MDKNHLRIRAGYYQQFDADLTLDVSGEGYGGWKEAELTFDRRRTAMVVMHAWDCGTPEQFPGWYRCVEYIPRATKIARTVFPPLLRAVRESGMTLYHVVGGGNTYQNLPGYQRATSLANHQPKPQRIRFDDPLMAAVQQFRNEHSFVGAHNVNDVNRGFKDIDFMEEARPQGSEGIAENADQLAGLCAADGINHLVYIGFAINWCLLLSPGGMADMSSRSIMCSTIRQAVTAVENKETARREVCKEIALWRVALAFGFVFDDHEFIRAVKANGN